MTDQPPPVRRLVSGDDAAGRSSIVDDGPALASSRTVPGRPGYRVTNIWTTLGTPARLFTQMRTTLTRSPGRA